MDERTTILSNPRERLTFLYVPNTCQSNVIYEIKKSKNGVQKAERPSAIKLILTDVD